MVIQKISEETFQLVQFSFINMYLYFFALVAEETEITAGVVDGIGGIVMTIMVVIEAVTGDLLRLTIGGVDAMIDLDPARIHLVSTNEG